jgi:hypothetical protein
LTQLPDIARPHTTGGRKFCVACGREMPESQRVCRSCGFDFASLPGYRGPRTANKISDKKFGTAVALCGVFGILGFHHFYLGNYLHGLFDLCLSIVAIGFIGFGSPEQIVFGYGLLVIDFTHTMIIMYRLFTGKARDGHGRIVAYPGQLIG